MTYHTGGADEVELFPPELIAALLVFYVVTAYCLMVIAQKTGLDDKAWWAFIPILNVLLMIFIADKEWWFILLLLIPLVNFVVAAIIYLGMAEERNKPAWMGILCFFWIGFPILAFGD